MCNYNVKMFISNVMIKKKIETKSFICFLNHKKVSEYDQEIPQSHTADQPTAPWGRATKHL